MTASIQPHPWVSTSTMHNSFVMFAQRMGNKSVTEHTNAPTTDTSRSPQTLATSRTSRSGNGHPVISEPIPEILEGELMRRFIPVQKHSSQHIHSSSQAKRRPSDMPLSCHPPMQTPWIDVQPLTTHVAKIGSQLVLGVSHAGTKPSSPVNTKTSKAPPRPTSLRPSSRLESMSQATSDTPTLKQKHLSKPTTSHKHISTPVNRFDQPIAPLQPRSYTCSEIDLHSAGSSRPYKLQSAQRRCDPAPIDSSHSYLPVPSALQTLWAKRRSSHVVLADNPLQLKIFSELNVELDEVMSLYTPSTMS